MTNSVKKNKGFTLIETLVAVLILVTAIAGPLSIASRGLTTALVAKDQITAYYLAQDAVEYIRFKRDTACLTGSVPCGDGEWLASVAACTGADGCYIDSTENEPVGTTPDACQSGGCIQSTFSSSRFLYYNTTAKRFTYATAGNTRTIFARQINLVVSPAGEAQLTVKVSWQDTGNITRSVTVTESIYNWQ